MENGRLSAVSGVAVDRDLAGGADEDVVDDLGLVRKSAEIEFGTALESAIGGESVIYEGGAVRTGGDECGDTAALKGGISLDDVVRHYGVGMSPHGNAAALAARGVSNNRITPDDVNASSEEGDAAAIAAGEIVGDGVADDLWLRRAADENAPTTGATGAPGLLVVCNGISLNQRRAEGNADTDAGAAKVGGDYIVLNCGRGAGDGDAAAVMSVSSGGAPVPDGESVKDGAGSFLGDELDDNIEAAAVNDGGGGAVDAFNGDGFAFEVDIFRIGAVGDEDSVAVRGAVNGSLDGGLIGGNMDCGGGGNRESGEA